MFMDRGVIFEYPLLVFLLSGSLLLLIELLILSDLFLEMNFIEGLLGGFIFLDFLDLELIIGRKNVDFLLILIAMLAGGCHG